jgi:hypothetical protein
MDSKATASTFFPESPQSLHLEQDSQDSDIGSLEAMMLLSLEPRIRSGAHVLVQKVTRSKTTPIVMVLRLP